MKTKTRTTTEKSATRSGHTPARTRIISPAPSQRVRWDFDIESILVPIDFSAQSEKALAYALPFARKFGAKLVLLHVVEPVATPDFVSSFPLAMENDKVMAECRRHLERVIRDLKVEKRLIQKTLVRYGRAFHEIAEAARTLKTDLILISTHGYTGLKHVLLGSTTERVVRHAPCPVLVVRPTERDWRGL